MNIPIVLENIVIVNIFDESKEFVPQKYNSKRNKYEKFKNTFSQVHKLNPGVSNKGKSINF